MPLVVYNTLTRRKEPFEPIEPGKVRMYVCGPTVYDSCHLGHARHGVVWDTIRRYLEYSGLEVDYVVNLTDIDDKIIDRAKEEGVDWREITSRYIPEYFEDMASLRVQRPTYEPRATEHIPEMVRAVRELVHKGHAYVADGSVYFSIATFDSYGKLSGRKPDDEGVARVESDPSKRAPADFALWKASKPGEPAWESPWGPGRPGWHIECSVMSAKYLGTPFDIHGGGEDLIFPHHENEIAQAEALTGEQFVRYWLHNGFITVAREKMSKSLGNFETLRDALRRCMPSTLRFFFLNAHYRSPIEYTPERLVEASCGRDRVYKCLEAVDRRLGGAEGEVDLEGHGEKGPIADAAEKAREAFDGLGAVFDLVSRTNGALESGPGGPGLGEAATVLRELLCVLGLPHDRERPAAGELEEKLIELLVATRGDARKAKQFELADRIRGEMKALGVEIEDLPGGGARVVRRVAREDT
ncbi:MAG: cysteine--tRNA ligase [Planctomycetota bacterium]